MPLEVIYLTRHGFRSNWVVNASTGEYTTTIRSPTNIPSDPALAGHGELQSRELASHLSRISPPIDRFYSSPFYRCLQTISPSVLAVSKTQAPETSTQNGEKEKEAEQAEQVEEKYKIRAEPGFGEWYGTARFDHPSPAALSLLVSLFPQTLSSDYNTPVIVPSTNGESIETLHNRVAYALARAIADVDEENAKGADIRSICICTHAATLIAMGRALTGHMPEDSGEEDFKPFTCGVSTFVRRTKGTDGKEGEVPKWEGVGKEIPRVEWREGKGVGGGWECTGNGDCSFLSEGEERGWHFSGDEAFSTGPEPVLNAAADKGVVVEEKHDEKQGAKSPGGGSRL